MGGVFSTAILIEELKHKLGWDVIGWAIAFFIPLGVGVIALSEPYLAKLCFAISAIVLGVKLGMWGVTAQQSFPIRATITVVCFGILGLFVVESFRWVDKKSSAELEQHIAPPKSNPPDVTLRFVYDKAPALVPVNLSDSVARDIKWTVALWNMDLPDRNDPLPIPVSVFDWLRPHTEGGPQNLFGSPLVAPLLKPGNRLFGSASVVCPECARGRTFVVYIVWEQGGWFSEIEGETSGGVVTPPNFKKEAREVYFRQLEALTQGKSRIPIGER